MRKLFQTLFNFILIIGIIRSFSLTISSNEKPFLLILIIFIWVISDLINYNKKN